jgi:hypothetical protein
MVQDIFRKRMSAVIIVRQMGEMIGKLTASGSQ